MVALAFSPDTQPSSDQVLSFPTPPGDLLPRQAGRMVPTTLSAGCMLVYSPAKCNNTIYVNPEQAETDPSHTAVSHSLLSLNR